MLYFDHNATTPIAPEVAAVFGNALEQMWGNASSIHAQGQAAREALERSRRIVARFLNASPAEIVFTSGGTESNNLAILGAVRGVQKPRKHVITTAIEHPSVLGPIAQLEREGVDVTYVRSDISAIRIRECLRPETVLISVMHANNETGTIQPLKEISSVAHGAGVLMHADGVQAAGRIMAEVRELDVDLYSISGHKINAPKGIGALFVAKGVQLQSLQFGGRHERERRAGTENVAGAIALAEAVELPTETERIAVMRDRFEAAVLKAVEGAQVNGARERLPNTSNICFDRVKGEAMVIALDMQGISVSTGSACSSGSIEPSHVLLAMGCSRDQAQSSVRFSFGRNNTAEDMERLIDTVIATAARLRKAKAGVLSHV